MMAELEDPREFPKALALLQAVNISLYTIIALVVYRYAGDSVASPALGSTGPLISKIAYGIALPTVITDRDSIARMHVICTDNSRQIVIAGVIYGHVAVKTIYIRIFAGTERMHKRDFIAVGVWVGMGLAVWISAWIIASAIPVFNNLLGLMVRSTLS
jgi:hypothetical protein